MELEGGENKALGWLAACTEGGARLACVAVSLCRRGAVRELERTPSRASREASRRAEAGGRADAMEVMGDGQQQQTDVESRVCRCRDTGRRRGGV